jgi:hypothetical protein
MERVVLPEEAQEVHFPFDLPSFLMERLQSKHGEM